MNLVELQLYAYSEEDTELEENEFLASEILKRVFSLFPKYRTYKNLCLSNLSLLATLYFYIAIENHEYKIVLDSLLERYHINKKAFILFYLQNLIYHKNPECYGIGTRNVFEENDTYKVFTEVGNIQVQKASEMFKEERYQSLWKKELKQHCFHRTYDFLKLNSEYHVVLAYLPNYLSRGYFHAYLENDTSIIDIARNLYFPKKEDGENLLEGEILARFSFEEVLEWEQFLHQNVKGFTESNAPTLGILCWHLDYTNVEQLKL